MVDTQSYLRKTRVGPCSVEIRQPFPSYQLLNSETAHRVFKTEHPKAHSCYQVTQDRYDPEHWPAFLLTFGLQQTQEDVNYLHAKDYSKRDIQSEESLKDKLLYSIGQKGKQEGYFQFPRGLAVSADGDLVIADTDNHRVQVFNSAAVLKHVIGKGRGSKPGELLSPTDVCWMPTGNYAVADQGNGRVQIFRPKGILRMMFLTKSKPQAITCDHKINLILTTVDRRVEVYRKGITYSNSFPIGGRSDFPAVSIAADGESIYICDTPTGKVRIYDYTGAVKRVFEPAASRQGLGMLPIGIDVINGGDIIIGDARNHTVNVYSNTGHFQEQLMGPVDDLGSVQCLRATPEGHIAVTEFTANGLHCLKIFRFQACVCHAVRKKSFKSGESTPIPKTHYLTKEVVDF